MKLYRPAAGEPDLWPGLAPAMTRPIRWDRIGEQYDQMLKYATAIRVGTASTEAILRRFMNANATHPTYQAMIELGRVQREIHEGLNVVESHRRRSSSPVSRLGIGRRTGADQFHVVLDTLQMP